MTLKSLSILLLCAFVLLIAAEVARASDDHARAVTQMQKSESVVRFWEGKGRWMRAPRYERCSAAPWPKTCVAARASYQLHRGLVRSLKRKLWFTLPAPSDWATATRIVQRAFPGTERWLLSCSAAEGSHGAWVRYGGGPYYPGYEHTGAVGGWLQYRWHTFQGHYRHGLDSLRSRGFKVSLPPPSDVRAWLSPLAQAIAGGWARWSGNDDSHWSASWGNGC